MNQDAFGINVQIFQDQHGWSAETAEAVKAAIWTLVKQRIGTKRPSGTKRFRAYNRLVTASKARNNFYAMAVEASRMGVDPDHINGVVALLK